MKVPFQIGVSAKGSKYSRRFQVKDSSKRVPKVSSEGFQVPNSNSQDESSLFWLDLTKLNTPKQKEPLRGVRFAEVLYADDTLLFGTHTHTINKLLHEMQRESDYYNLKLNYDKCINLTLHQRQSSIKYLDGTHVPRKREATYLGTLLSDSANNHREVSNRLAAALATCNRMKLFWDKANTTVRWKLRVFDSILRSKVLYGPDLAKINAFQMKFLRRILKIPPTFIDRSYPNQRVLEILRDTYHLSIDLFSQVWLHRKLKLFGHILRSSPDDPLRQVLFEYNSFIPRIEYRRPGRPRTDWLLQSFKDAFAHLGRADEFDSNNFEHIQFIVRNANTRQGIFAWLHASSTGVIPFNLFHCSVRCCLIFLWLLDWRQRLPSPNVVTECRHRMQSPFSHTFHWR